MDIRVPSKIWILAILLVLVVLGIVAWQYWWLPSQKVPTKLPGIGTKEGITVNEEAVGAPSSPMDLILSISSFSEERTAEITVQIGKRTGYPTEWFDARDISAEVQLPEGLELVEGNLNWKGNIRGDEIAEFKAKAKAVKNGEWEVVATAGTENLSPYEFAGDTERLYVWISGKEVLVSDVSFTTPTPEEKAEEIAWIPEYPEEYLIYQDYLQTIGGVSRISDVGIIEATVVSITKSEACPYPEEKCRIEPYPKDIGVVRIDKIIDYTSYSERSVEQPIEQPARGEEPVEEETTPEYRGKEFPQPKPIEYKALQIGQEVPTSFILTTRLVKVRYVSIPPQGEPEPGPGGGLESEPEEPVEHPIGTGEEPLPKTYKPIPKEGNYFVFTTKILEYPETAQRILPGLTVGSKFQAKVYYDGTLYTEEYEAVGTY